MYKVLSETDEHKFHIVEITMGEFKDIKFTYGGIKINENEDDSATLSFDFDVKNKTLNDEENTRFGKLIGDILVQILESQLDKNEAVYSGGTE